MNNLYALNKENIEMMLLYDYNVTPQNNVWHNNYMLVCSKMSKLSEYINENIDLYLKIVMENCNELITDDEESALMIINNDAINLEQRVQYLKTLDIIFSDLTLIPEYDIGMKYSNKTK